jgi:hypothetical protein
MMSLNDAVQTVNAAMVVGKMAVFAVEGWSNELFTVQ